MSRFRFCVCQSAEEIAPDAIASAGLGGADPMSTFVEAPGARLGQDRGMDEIRGHPVRLNQVADGGEVPDHFALPDAAEVVVSEYLAQVVADRALRGDESFDT